MRNDECGMMNEEKRKNARAQAAVSIPSIQSIETNGLTVDCGIGFSAWVFPVDLSAGRYYNRSRDATRIGGLFSAVKNEVKRLLLGLGLDNSDGHVRVTRGDNFRLLGGSQETHELMQEHAIKLNEKLKERSKTLDTVSEKEFGEIAKEIGLKKVE